MKLEPNEKVKALNLLMQLKEEQFQENLFQQFRRVLKATMKAGVVAGYPVVDIKVTVYDGSYHDVDSSEAAFKIAGSWHLRKE